MALNEATIINQIALYEGQIAGVKKSYSYSENPDQINLAALPCVVHYVPEFTVDLRAHHLQFKTTLTVRSIMLGVPREAKGGQLRYLENTIIPFGQKWRNQFTSKTVIDAITAATGSLRCWITRGEYGAGGDLLTYNNTPYLGYVFDFTVLD